MNSPTPRMIRIGSTSIGLIGLDIAINKAVSAHLPLEQAVDAIFQAVQKQNYIPAVMDKKYRHAIGMEYNRQLGADQEQEQAIVIRILGTGCISCNGLQDTVINALERAGVAADIEQIHDRDEIGRLGVTSTPALIINGRVRTAGILPTLAQVEAWILEAASL